MGEVYHPDPRLNRFKSATTYADTSSGCVSGLHALGASTERLDLTIRTVG